MDAISKYCLTRNTGIKKGVECKTLQQVPIAELLVCRYTQSRKLLAIINRWYKN